MNSFFIKNILIGLAISLSFSAIAQSDKYSTTASIGITSPLLNKGLGFHVGVNPKFSLTPGFALEGQVSYIYTHIGSAFLSGKESNYNTINVLSGGRLYLSDESARQRLYLNLLLGGNYLNQRFQSGAKSESYNLGFSSGLYIEGSQIVIGISYDSPRNNVLKVGFIF